MFNNTFLGNTFACYIYYKEGGEKKLFHSLTLETAAQTSASPFHGWICSGGEEPSGLGAVSASRVQTPQTPGAVPCFTLSGAQQGRGLLLRATGAPHSPLGPLQSPSCASAPGETPAAHPAERGGHELSSPSRVPHSSSEHMCRFCSHISKFPNEGFSTPFSPAQGAVTNISS